MATATLQIGLAIGVATLGGWFFSDLGTHPLPADYLRSFKSVMAMLVAVQALCVFLSFALGPLHRRLRRLG
jgi:hypothetical protein